MSQWLTYCKTEKECKLHCTNYLITAEGYSITLTECYTKLSNHTLHQYFKESPELSITPSYPSDTTCYPNQFTTADPGDSPVIPDPGNPVPQSHGSSGWQVNQLGSSVTCVTCAATPYK